MSDKNYAMGHAFSLHDTFMNFPVEKLKMTTEQCKETYSDGSKRDLAASIFARSVQMVVDDIIDNNVHFKLPGMGRTQAYLYMKRTEGKKFKKAFKNGKWNDVDFIMSNFSGYQLTLEMQSEKRLPREKPIYLSGKDKQRIIDNTMTIFVKSIQIFRGRILKEFCNTDGNRYTYIIVMEEIL